MRKAWIVAAVCGVAALGAPVTHADPACGVSTPMANLFATPVMNCPDHKPAQAYAWQLSNPSVNTGRNDIVCEENFGGGTACSTMPGSNVVNDNNVGIETDWANPGTIGCPVGRVMISLLCNDGSGALLSVAGSCPDFGYNPELAYPIDEGGNFAPLELGPTPTRNAVLTNGRVTIGTVSRNASMDAIPFQVDPPTTVQSDCSPGSVGEQIDALFQCIGCPFAPTIERGRVFWSNQPCNDKPDLRYRRFCSAPASALGRLCNINTDCAAAGGVCRDPGNCIGGTNPGAICPTNACQGGICVPLWTSASFDTQTGAGMMNIPTPATGTCNYIGTTSIIDGIESGGMTGVIEVGGPDAASPVAEAVRVVRKANAIEVSFKTSSELGLAGFNIFAAGKAKGEIKINAALIPATGVGGAGTSYSQSYTLGDLKGHRGIIVESVLTDGSTLRAAVVEF